MSALRQKQSFDSPHVVSASAHHQSPALLFRSRARMDMGTGAIHGFTKN